MVFGDLSIFLLSLSAVILTIVLIVIIVTIYIILKKQTNNVSIGIEHNEIEHNEIEHNETEHGESEHNESEHNEIIISVDEEDKNIDCSICLDTDESNITILSVCKHKFHINCIKKQLYCPNCRKKILHV
jgi:hypothetical protein